MVLMVLWFCANNIATNGRAADFGHGYASNTMCIRIKMIVTGSDVHPAFSHTSNSCSMQ